MSRDAYELAGEAWGWDHEAYLRAAWSELRRRPFAEAVGRLRQAARPGTDHATLSLAWARLVATAIARSGPGADFEDFLGRHPELRDARRALDHYSPERLASPRARREFVLPDREPLPAGGRKTVSPA